MGENLYEKFGGEETIAKVVDYLYNELVLKDESINQFYLQTDMEKQIVHQTKFISIALGGPEQYSGKSMSKAHASMNLQPDHFNAIAKHLHDALAHFGVNNADIDQVLTTVSSLQAEILYK